MHFLVFVGKKLWKYSCRKWYFPFPQFSPWSADWAWKRHKIGHLAGPGESLRRLSTTSPKLNPFHLLKLLINVSSVFQWSSILPQTCNIWKQCHILSPNPHSPQKRRRYTIIRCFLIHVSWGGEDRKAMCVISLTDKECSQLSLCPSLELLSIEMMLTMLIQFKCEHGKILCYSSCQCVHFYEQLYKGGKFYMKTICFRENKVCLSLQ